MDKVNDKSSKSESVEKIKVGDASNKESSNKIRKAEEDVSDKSAKKMKKMKPHRKALFNLLNDHDYYKNITDKAELDVLQAKVERLVEEDPDCVTRKFWCASIPYEYESRYGDYDDEVGVDHDQEEIEGLASSVWLAANKGFDRVLLFLLDHGGEACVNECWGIDCCQVRTALAAIYSGNVECLKLLHKRGAKLEECYDLSYGGMANVAKKIGCTDILDFLESIGYSD